MQSGQQSFRTIATSPAASDSPEEARRRPCAFDAQAENSQARAEAEQEQQYRRGNKQYSLVI